MSKKKVNKLSDVIFNNPFVRTKWADYADAKLVPKYQVCRFDDKGDNRFYYFHWNNELIIASGVTEPFGWVSTERERLNEWKEKNPNWRHLLNISSDYGTLEHILYGGMGLGNGVNKELLTAMAKIAKDNGKSVDMPVKDTLAFLKFQEDYKIKTLLVEGQLAWYDEKNKEWLCLTVDWLGEIEIVNVTKEMVEDGVWQRGEKKGQPKFVEVKTETPCRIIALIDFKSNFFEKEKKSFFETNKMQLMAGKLAVEQNFDIKVDRIYNFAPNNWRSAPSYTLYEHKPTDKDWRKFWGYWEIILADDMNKPSGGFIVADKFKDSSDYKMLSYKEYVEQVLMKP